MGNDGVPVRVGGVADDLPAPVVRQGVGATAVAVSGLSLTILNAMFTMCACGHYSMVSVPGALLAICLVWLAFACSEDVSLPGRLLIAAAVVVATFALVKMFIGFLWAGHSAILEYNQHVAAAVGAEMVRASLVSLGVLAAVVLMRGMQRVAVRWLAWMNRGREGQGA